MDLGRAVRRIYQKHPYPPPALRKSVGAGPPREWVEAMAGLREPLDPRRVLVAGCGIGTEAFALAERFAAAEVVGVDFSPRAIEQARKDLKKAPDRQRIRFEVADLMARELAAAAGREFDYVSCHGVVSYIPDTAMALRNIASLMRPGAVLVLGVNGAGHLSPRYRRILGEFGIDVRQFRDGHEVRQVLRLCDSLKLDPPVSVADYDAGYLAGDIFGPLNHSLPLAEWKAMCGDAGLHVAASMRGFFASREIVNRDLAPIVLPRTRSVVAEVADVLYPSSFHTLVVVRGEPAPNAFRSASTVLRSRAAVTSLYNMRLPRKGRGLQKVTLRSPATNTEVTLNIPAWEVEILRNADGTRKIGELLNPRVPPQEVRNALYLLYLLGAMNLWLN